MKVLVLGASGATGRLAVSQLIDRGIEVKAVLRMDSVLPDGLVSKKGLELVRGNISDFDPVMNDGLVAGCDAIVCCLGHNITFKGMFGRPQLLVTRSLKHVCEAAARTGRKIKLVLMSTTANEDRDVKEARSFGERLVLSVLYALLPPHRDNIRAARYLASVVGRQNAKLEWVAVRPDGLIDEDVVGPYETLPAITRSPLFDPGKASRINVGHFMAELLTRDELWQKWKGRMPVLYNREA